MPDPWCCTITATRMHHLHVLLTLVTTAIQLLTESCGQIANSTGSPWGMSGGKENWQSQTLELEN